MERGIGTAHGSETARAVGTTRGTGAARAAAVLATLLWALWQCFGNLGAANISSDEPVYLSAGWSYLLPKALVKGRYVLDDEATDTAGNRTDYFRNGVNRVKFKVV